MNITIRVRNKNRAEKLIEFLKELPYVEVAAEKSESSLGAGIKSLFGIWKDREVSVETIRSRAWKREK